MDKGLLYIITTVICILLQLAIAPAIQVFGALPNFLIIPVLFIALRSGATAGSIAGFALGLLYDFAGNGVIGAMPLAFVVVALLVGLAGSAMEMGPVMAAVVAIVASILGELLYGLATMFGAAAADGALATMFAYALPCGIYTAVFAAIALALMSAASPAEAPRMSGGFGTGGRGGFLG